MKEFVVSVLFLSHCLLKETILCGLLVFFQLHLEFLLWLIDLCYIMATEYTAIFNNTNTSSESTIQLLETNRLEINNGRRNESL